MIRSLYSAVSGMNVHQTKLNVIGNNIANVNTYGFKSSRVVFSDVLYQSVQNSVAGEAGRGGVNPSQLGYGTKVGTIDLVNTNASGADTGRSMDVFIDGDGYLIARTGGTVDNTDPTAPVITDPIIKYTRIGNLSFDTAGNLVDSNGSILQGKVATFTNDGDGKYTIEDGDEVYPIGEDENGPTTDEVELTDFQIAPGAFDNITAIAIDYSGAVTGISDGKPVVLGYIALANFANPDALSQDGNGYFVQSNNSGNPNLTGAQQNGAGRLVAGGLEMSNVDLSKEFTEMITAQRGFQANSRIVSVSDSILEELINLKR